MFFFSRIYFTIFSCKPRFHTTKITHTHTTNTGAWKAALFIRSSPLPILASHKLQSAKEKKRQKTIEENKNCGNPWTRAVFLSVFHKGGYVRFALLVYKWRSTYVCGFSSNARIMAQGGQTHYLACIVYCSYEQRSGTMVIISGVLLFENNICHSSLLYISTRSRPIQTHIAKWGEYK